METGIFIQVRAPELSVNNKVASHLESVPGEIRDSAFVSPDSIRRHRRVLAVLIPEVDIRRLVLAYVGFYVVASMSIVLDVDPFMVDVCPPVLLGGLVFIPIGVPLSK
uniref:Uncharacterized protein n=1 Tax=Oryza sativa subsp. japonica TaxID=39947 RepID=Q67WV3_ORYSJ|nr:hypothetical protein [Oryza sativa Japonica Group]